MAPKTLATRVMGDLTINMVKEVTKVDMVIIRTLVVKAINIETHNKTKEV